MLASGSAESDVGCTDVGCGRKSGVKGGPQVFAFGHSDSITEKTVE